MILYPAVDIYDGKCVRLSQGDFNRMTVYFDHPEDAARQWAGVGATWLHVVDLNGALEGRPINLAAVRSVITSVEIPCQIGGGIRSEESASSLLSAGARRVVLGSALLEDPDLVQGLCKRYPQRIAVGIDARGGKVAIHGWKETVDREATEVARGLEGFGIAAMIYTDISRDGTMTGPNFQAIERILKAVSLPVIASGGISSMEDLSQLKALGAHGAILGRALYEGRIDLGGALKEFERN